MTTSAKTKALALLPKLSPDELADLARQALVDFLDRERPDGWEPLDCIKAHHVADLSRAVEAHTARRVADARSWQAVADCYKVTRQAAHERFAAH